MDDDLRDVPPGMNPNAYGGYELDGVCIWINATQDQFHEHVPVLSHEYAHYVQAVSTYFGVGDLLHITSELHAGIQYLEDLGIPVHVPLRDWVAAGTAPESVRKTVAAVDRVRQRRQWENSTYTDPAPATAQVGGLPAYQKSGEIHLVATGAHGNRVGVPIRRLVLAEGMAVAAKALTLGSLEDLEAKTHAGAWHYIAAYQACRSAAPGWPEDSVLLATKCTCDLALCSRTPGSTFTRALRALRDLSSPASSDELARALTPVYDSDCRRDMHDITATLDQVISQTPDSHKGPQPSWSHLMHVSAKGALQCRDRDPLCLAVPTYAGEHLCTLVASIGHPVIITNDMRITVLCAEPPPGVQQARNLVRILSALSRWVVEGGTLACPYAGCPGCPAESRGPHCSTDPRSVIRPPNEKMCYFSAAAHQLFITRFL